MSAASGVSAASDASDDVTTQVAAAEHEPAAAVPHIQVLKGNPTDEELAAVVAVLGAAGGGSADTGTPDRNMWGHPVDKLRMPLFSWQRITLLERTHMRR